MRGTATNEKPWSSDIEPTAVVCYRALDNSMHTSRSSAKRQNERISQADWATVSLQGGQSIASILRGLDLSVPDPILEEVTKDSKLVIPHWQCRETPCYRPLRFDAGPKLLVGGDAGSWSGCHSNYVTISDLVRYSRDSRSIL